MRNINVAGCFYLIYDTDRWNHACPAEYHVLHFGYNQSKPCMRAVIDVGWKNLAGSTFFHRDCNGGGQKGSDDPFGALTLENRLSLSVQQVFIISRRNLTTRIILIKNYEEHRYFILWQLICKIDQRLLITAIIVGFKKNAKYICCGLALRQGGHQSSTQYWSVRLHKYLPRAHYLGPLWFINDHDSLIISVILSDD